MISDELSAVQGVGVSHLPCNTQDRAKAIQQPSAMYVAKANAVGSERAISIDNAVLDVCAERDHLRLGLPNARFAFNEL